MYNSIKLISILSAVKIVQFTILYESGVQNVHKFVYRQCDINKDEQSQCDINKDEQ